MNPSETFTVAEALEPFAAVAAKLSPDLPDDTPVTLMLKEGVIYVYALSRFRQARTALSNLRHQSEAGQP